MNVIHLRVAILCMFFWLTGIPATAQNNETPFIKVSDNPLSKAITSISQDSYGFLWVGTEKGLTRFDGNEYKVFDSEIYDSIPALNDYIRTLYLDSKGYLWIGTNKGGAIYNPYSGTFTNLSPILESVTIRAILTLPSGEILIGTSHGVAISDHAGHIRFLTNKEIPEIFGENISFLRSDSRGNIWMANNNFFCQVEFPETPLFNKSVRLNTRIFKRNSALGFFSIDPFDNIWFYDGEIVYRTPIMGPDRIGKEEIIKTGFYSPAIHHDTKSNITFLNRQYQRLDLLYMDKSGMIIRQKEMLFNNPGTNHMSQNIASIYQDQQNNIWLGTKDGLYYYDKNSRNHFSSITKSDGYTNGLLHNIVSDIYEDSKGNLWLGTANGLNKLRFIEGKPVMEHFTDNHSNSNYTQNNRIQAVVEDRDQILWVGSKYGICNFDPIKKQFFITPQAEKFQAGHERQFVRTIYRDSRDFIWTGFMYGGLVYYNPDTKQFGKITVPGNEFNLSDIWAIIEDKGHDIWFGTKREGIYRFTSDGKLSNSHIKNMRHYTFSSPEDPDKICTDWATSLFVDHDGHLWAGTAKGIWKYNPNKDRFDRVKLSLQDEDIYICGINQDKTGNLWISSTNGTYLYNEQNKNFVFFELNNGDFARVEYTFGNCVCRDGRLVFGGINGLTYFFPDKIAIDTTDTGRIFITDIRIGNREIVPDGRHLDQDINISDHIKLIYPENQFSIGFSSLQLNNPQYIKYAYKLDGIDNDWIYARWNKNYASYTNLPPGKYTLRIKSTNKNGTWLDNARSIEIIVAPPWYGTTLAYSIYFLLLGVMTFIVLRIIVIRNRYKQTEKLNQIKQRFFINITHGFKTPLMLLQTPLHCLMKNEKNLSESEQKLMLEMMDRNIKKMSNLIKQLLEFRKIDQHKATLFLVEMNIIRFIEEIGRSFRPMFLDKEIDLCFESDLPAVTVTVDPEKIETILFNLLSNAYKFTPRGGMVKIKCHLEPTDYKLFISVQDSGIGIRSEDKQKIFERFWQVKNTENNLQTDGAGIGLSLSKDLVELHHGKLSVESSPDKGSTFTFSLLLGSKHFGKKYIEKETDPIRPLLIDCYIDTSKEIYFEHNDETKKDLCLIYLISENRDTHNLIRFILKDYNVRSFESLENIQEKAQEEQPSLVICDMVIHDNPLMLNFCRNFKCRPETNSIPIVILTPENSKEENIIGYEVGVDTIIEKPFGPEYLTARIRQIIRSRTELKEKIKMDIIITPKSEPGESGDEKFINSVMKVIEKNMSNEEFSLMDFAREMNSSKSVLHTRLQHLTRQSPIEFLRTVRLKKSAQLLTLNAYSITQVSYMVGFSDPRYFSTCFKKQFGMTPREYIHQHKENENTH